MSNGHTTVQATPVRQVCSQALLMFLLDYPLSPKRLKQHLKFILENLAYEHETGRLTAIEMLGTIVAKFPPEVTGAFSSGSDGPL